MNKITTPEQAITNDHGEPHTYVFEENAINAINAALLINRPLLVRGEPGVGKSQLAKAAAEALKRTYIPFVVSASTEAQDLLWSFDAVARLADAQIEGALCGSSEKERKDARARLELSKYIKPAPLWATLNWQSAQDQYDNTHNPESSPMPNYHNSGFAKENGVVLLIDEIDKADSSVPNGLLEVLGANRFHPDGMDKPVEVDVDKDAKKPLIIITTNEERTLPDAFIRRCLSVTLGLPEQRKEQIDYLVKHAKPNFKILDIELETEDRIDNSEGNSKDNSKDNKEKNNQTILEATANIILDDREQAQKHNLHPLPGQAEYFDLLRGIKKQFEEEKDIARINVLVKQLSLFTSKKHPDFPEAQKHKGA